MPIQKTDPFAATWGETLSFVSEEFGLSVKDIKRSVVPSWLGVPTEDQSSLDEAHRLLASALHVPVDRLQGRIRPLVSKPGACRCKGATPEKLTAQRPARCLAETLGRHLVSVFEKDALPVCDSASVIRDRLLAKTSEIKLETLLRECWRMNVPVAHLAQAPKHAPHAMAVNVDGRCAIVLIRNKRHQGWHLFDLAHELGHIMLGHVPPGEVIVEGDGMRLEDAEERAANDFAMDLLAGTHMVGSDARSAEQLLARCELSSRRLHVDAQWLIVYSGFLTDKWGAAVSALNLGWPDDDAVGVIENVLTDQLFEREVTRTRRALIEQMAVRPNTAA